MNDPIVDPISEGAMPSWQENVDRVRRAMEDMLIPLFLDQQACRKIGFTNISRLIGYIPGWYLWSKERQGAFLLELMKLRSFDRQFIAAYFLIRYYPSFAETDFHDFAPMERQVRMSSFFDQTGTPRFENKDEIHESLFAVGNLNMEIDKGLNLIKLKLFSQNRWREVRKYHQDAEGTGAQSIQPVSYFETHRNVPGWKLSWSLFDKLLLGFCFVHRSPPLGLRLTVSPGVEYHLEANGMASEVPESTIQRWTLETGILLKSAPNSNRALETWKKKFHASLCRPLKKGEKLIATLVDPPEKKYLWIDSNWWAFAAWTFSQPVEINHRCFQDH